MTQREKRTNQLLNFICDNDFHWMTSWKTKTHKHNVFDATIEGSTVVIIVTSPIKSQDINNLEWEFFVSNFTTSPKLMELEEIKANP